MLHELLLALFGTTGGIILESDDGDSFLVNPKLTFLTPAEVELLTRIVQLGSMFKRIQKFQTKYGGIGTKLALQLAYSGGNPDGQKQLMVRKRLLCDNVSSLDDGYRK